MQKIMRTDAHLLQMCLIMNNARKKQWSVIREEGGRLCLLLRGGFKKFHTGVNGENYRFHPDRSNCHLEYAVGFRTCFTCGDRYRFNDCPTKLMPNEKN